jgi:hypothetical protein
VSRRFPVCHAREITKVDPPLAKAKQEEHDFDMSTVTIALPDPLDAALLERMTAVGAHSKEEYLLALIESDCAASELERVLVDRLAGPFEPLEIDWKQRVRQSAPNSQ